MGEGDGPAPSVPTALNHVFFDLDIGDLNAESDVKVVYSRV